MAVVLDGGVHHPRCDTEPAQPREQFRQQPVRDLLRFAHDDVGRVAAQQPRRSDMLGGAFQLRQVGTFAEPDEQFRGESLQTLLVGARRAQPGNVSMMLASCAQPTGELR